MWLSSPYTTSINAITPFIFNIHHLFYMLLRDLLLIIHTYFCHPTFIVKTTIRQSTVFSPSLCEAILNKSQP